MGRLQQKYQAIEFNYDLFNLIVAKGSLPGLMANKVVKSLIGCHELKIPTRLERVV